MDLQENWAIETDALRDFLPTLAAAADTVRPVLDTSSSAEEVFLTKIDDLNGTHLLHCTAARPHIDYLSDRWTALLIVKANNHRVGSQDITCDSDLQDEEYLVLRDEWDRVWAEDNPDQETIAQAGDIILLDVNRLHWLDMADCNVTDFPWHEDREEARRLADENRLVAVHLEFEKRPSREEVEEAFMARLGLEQTVSLRRG